MEVGQERAAVEMAPGPLLGVVVDRKLRPAFGTGKPSGFRMLGPQLDTAPVYKQLDPTHLPWSDEPQQVAVELGVTHRPIVAEDLHVDLANISSGNSPTHKPEAPPKGLRRTESQGPDTIPHRQVENTRRQNTRNSRASNAGLDQLTNTER